MTDAAKKIGSRAIQLGQFLSPAPLIVVGPGVACSRGYVSRRERKESGVLRVEAPPWADTGDQKSGRSRLTGTQKREDHRGIRHLWPGASRERPDESLEIPNDLGLPRFRNFL